METKLNVRFGSWSTLIQNVIHISNWRTVNKQLLILVWQNFGFAYIYLFTQHVNFRFRKPHIAMHFNSIELYILVCSDCALAVTTPNDLYLHHMQSVQSSCWANTNCDRQQQMQNARECHKSGKCNDWQLQLLVTNALISNNNDSFLWSRICRATKDAIIKCEKEIPKDATKCTKTNGTICNVLGRRMINPLDILKLCVQCTPHRRIFSWLPGMQPASEWNTTQKRNSITNNVKVSFEWCAIHFPVKTATDDGDDDAR